MEHLPDVIKALQNLQDNQAAVLAVGEAKDKAEAELKAVQSKLEQTKRELQSETAGLTQAQADIKKSYDRDLNNAQMELKNLQKLISESEAKLAQLDGSVRDKQGQHDAVVRGLNALRDRIEGRAA